VNKNSADPVPTEATDMPFNKQQIHHDLLVIAVLALLVYWVAGYFDLAERYIDWTALGELYQLDEIVFVLLAICLGLIWFSLRRIRELKHILLHNLTMQHNLRKTNQHISQLLENNRALVKHIALVRESERQHLATELHDVFGQHLAAMDANLTVATNLNEDSKLSEILVAVMDSTTHLRTLTRDKLRNLKPPILKSIGLSGAVQELLHDWRLSFPDISVTAELDIHDEQLDEDVALTLYRAIQEGLVNISRHAHADTVFLKLEEQHHQQQHSLHLLLEDNGKGVLSDSKDKGMGLIGVRERTEALDGHFSLSPASPTGTRLQITIPKQPSV
jgi:glucose-6-phosphate-specific signal transduction histidine kinase